VQTQLKTPLKTPINRKRQILHKHNIAIFFLTLPKHRKVLLCFWHSSTD